MNSEFDMSQGVSYSLGTIAVENATDGFDEVCSHERRRRTLRNEAEIPSLRARGAILEAERTSVGRTLDGLPREARVPTVKRIFSWILFSLFAIAGFAFAFMALAPFALGRMTVVYAAAIGVVAGYYTERFLEAFHWRPVILMVIAIGFVAGLAGLVVLAHVRGEILILNLRQALASTDPDSLKDTLAATARFYERAGPLLQIFFGLLAVSMELATGLALHDAWKSDSPNHDLAVALHTRLAGIETELIEIIRQIAYLERDAEIVDSQLRRDHALGLLHGAKRNYLVQSARTASRVAPLLLVAAVLCHAQSLYHIGDDFSISSGPKGYGRTTANEQNTAAAAELISHLPVGARFDVRGITDDSFARPYPVLAGAIPENDGRFPLIDPTAAARARYAAAMRAAGASIKPTFKSTDVIGFLISEGELLRNASATRRVLVLLSDMRHSTKPFDIETPKVIPVAAALKAVAANQAFADLRGVDVYCLGVHAVGKDAEYWRSLREFWTAYFAKSGATLKRFSMERDIVDLGTNGR
jgi:hypothetical protein